MTEYADDQDPPTPAEPGLDSLARAAKLARGVWTFVVDWLPVFIVLFAYDAIHNRLGAFIPPAHTWPQIHADEALFGAPVPTVRLQQALYSMSHPHGWDFAALAVYTSHFVVPELIALLLWFRSRGRYLRFMTSFVGMTTLGYATYVLFPAVPPWLASQHGDLAPTHRLVRELWDHMGQHGIAGLFSGTNLYANDVAAIPSLHAAYPVLIALFFWPGSGRLLRSGLALYAVAMALALVYSAEHFVVDIALGWLYAIVTALIVQRLWPRASAPARIEPARR
jgi:membrane-associated phospholipid phosphatase